MQTLYQIWATGNHHVIILTIIPALAIPYIVFFGGK